MKVFKSQLSKFLKKDVDEEMIEKSSGFKIEVYKIEKLEKKYCLLPPILLITLENCYSETKDTYIHSVFQRIYIFYVLFCQVNVSSKGHRQVKVILKKTWLSFKNIMTEDLPKTSEKYYAKQVIENI